MPKALNTYADNFFPFSLLIFSVFFAMLIFGMKREKKGKLAKNWQLSAHGLKRIMEPPDAIKPDIIKNS